MAKSQATYSEYIDPLVEVNQGRPKSLFREKVEGLEVGKAFIVTGMTQNNCSSRANVIGKENHPRRKFTVNKLDDASIQIVRKE